VKTALVFCALLAIDGPLVERAAPGQAPTAFRLFAAGENVADDGTVLFTKASAEALLAEQAERARLYPSDFDHLSLITDRPADAGRASGWHRLEVRNDADGNPELWAVDVQWCTDVKAGLEEQPPKWRYFSPAFKRNTETNEVVSYVNFALCINPLTHGLPSLAAAIPEGKTMLTKEQCAAHLKTLADIGAGEDERKSAMKALAEYFEGQPEEKPKDGDKGEAGEGEEARERAEGDGEKKPETQEKKAEGEEPADGDKVEKKAVTAMATELEATKRENDQLKIAAMLKDRADLPESIRAWCATQSLETVKGYLANSPKRANPREERPVQGEGAGAPQGLQGAELEELNRAMGVRPPVTKQFERTEGGELVMHNIGPTRARELAMKAEGARK